MGCFVIKTVSLKTELLEDMIYFDFPPSLPMSRLKGKAYCVIRGNFYCVYCMYPCTNC